MITCTFENENKASLRHVTIDAIIVDNNKILLVKRSPNFSNGNKWASPGGFLGRDENASQAIVREVLEETGYNAEVENLFSITDKPDRKGEDRQNVNLTFLVKALEKVSEHDHEISETHWFELDKLPPEDDFAFDHYNRIKLYIKYLSEKFNLPIMES